MLGSVRSRLLRWSSLSFTFRGRLDPRISSSSSVPSALDGGDLTFVLLFLLAGTLFVFSAIFFRRLSRRAVRTSATHGSLSEAVQQNGVNVEEAHDPLSSLA